MVLATCSDETPGFSPVLWITTSLEDPVWHSCHRSPWSLMSLLIDTHTQITCGDFFIDNCMGCWRLVCGHGWNILVWEALGSPDSFYMFVTVRYGISCFLLTWGWILIPFTLLLSWIVPCFTSSPVGSKGSFIGGKVPYNTTENLATWSLNQIC